MFSGNVVLRKAAPLQRTYLLQLLLYHRCSLLLIQVLHPLLHTTHLHFEVVDLLKMS